MCIPNITANVNATKVRMKLNETSDFRMRLKDTTEMNAKNNHL